MAAISGVSGNANFGGVINITGWTCTVEAPIKNVSDSASGGWEDNIVSGFRRWTGSLEGWLKTSMSLPTMTASGTLTLTLATGMTYSGTAIIISQVTTLGIDAGSEAVKIAFNYVGTGALTQDVIP